MLLPKRIRKIIALLRGQVSPLLAGLSVGLGFWFGLMPGFYGIHALLLVFLILLNIPIGLFILSAGIGKAAALAAAPVLYHMGVFVVDHIPVFIHIVEKIPLAGATDFDRDAVTGALLAGPIAGAVLGWVVGLIILAFRKTWLKLESNSEKFIQWQQKKWIRFLDRVIVGKRAKDAKSTLEVKAKLIRKGGLALAILLLLLFLGLSWAFKNSMIKDKVTAKLAQANGATVDIGNIDLSPLTGSLGVKDLAVADKDNLNNNQFQIDELSTKASVYQLSLGKLVMDQITVSGVKFDQKRSEPAQLVEKPNPTPEPPAQVKEETPSGWDKARLEGYLKDAQKVKDFIGKIRPWLPQRQSKAALSEEKPPRFLDYLTKRMDRHPQVRMLAKKILLDQVTLPDQQFGLSTITLKNINDAPMTAQLPLELNIASQAGPQLDAILHFDDPNQPGKLTASFTALDLARLQAGLKSDNAMIFEQGKASGKIEGILTRDQVDLTIKAQLSELQAQAGAGLFGLDAQTTQQALNALKNLDLTLKITGPLSTPSLAFDSQALQNELKSKLTEIGREKAKEEINRVIEKNLPEKVPEDINNVIKPDVIKKGLQDLLGGKK